jgi:cytochrome c oxidase cbb3-type subunit III
MKHSARCRLLLAACAATLAACSPHGKGAGQGGEAAAPAIRYEAHVSAGGLAPPVGDLKNPFAGDASAAKNGAALFVAMNCDGCHGGDGAGWVGPSLADGRWRYGGADEELFVSIFYGRPKGMPAFGGALTQESIWTLVAYLKSLTPPAGVPTQVFDDKGP